MLMCDWRCLSKQRKSEGGQVFFKDEVAVELQ